MTKFEYQEDMWYVPLNLSKEDRNKMENRFKEAEGHFKKHPEELEEFEKACREVFHIPQEGESK